MIAGTFVFKVGALDAAIVGAVFSGCRLELVNGGAPPDRMCAHFVENWKQNLVGRLLALPAPLAPSPPVLVGVNANHFWIPDETGVFTATTHAAKLSGNLWKMPETKLANQLTSEWNDADSLPRRAWDWHRLDHWEKCWSQLVWERGSRRELENLTRAMIYSDTELWRERDLWGINYKFLPDGNASVESVRAHTVLRAPSERIARLGRLFLERNRASLQRPPLLPALTPARSFSPDGYAWIHLRYSAPSQHERLEAHLLLRDWLQDK